MPETNRSRPVNSASARVSMPIVPFMKSCDSYSLACGKKAQYLPSERQLVALSYKEHWFWQLNVWMCKSSKARWRVLAESRAIVVKELSFSASRSSVDEYVKPTYTSLFGFELVSYARIMTIGSSWQASLIIVPLYSSIKMPGMTRLWPEL